MSKRTREVHHRDLHPDLLRALELAGLARPNRIYTVEGCDKVDLRTSAGQGQRGFCHVVDLESGSVQSRQGSWGGSNPFVTTSDDTREVKLLSDNEVVIKGSAGHRLFFTVYTSSLERMPADTGSDLTQRERDLLGLMRQKSAYRWESLSRRGITRDSAELSALCDKGYLKRNRAGALSLTAKGRNNATPNIW